MSSPAEISRSEIVSLRRPPQIERSVVVGTGLVDASPNEVEQRRGELVRAGLAALRRSVGISAGSVSVGGSCSYSRSYPVRRSRPRNQKTSQMTRSAGIVASASVTMPVRTGCVFSASMRSRSVW